MRYVLFAAGLVLAGCATPAGSSSAGSRVVSPLVAQGPSLEGIAEDETWKDETKNDVAHGFALTTPDDRRKLELEFPVYDALYAYFEKKARESQ